MNYEFLGMGWRFPVTTEQGQIATAGYEESIRQAIWQILATAPGERMMRPDFGCGIHNLLFAVNDATTASHAAGEVRQALLEWEPRIEVIDVAASADPQAANRLLIRIEYRVPATNNRFNLVYPFYME